MGYGIEGRTVKTVAEGIVERAGSTLAYEPGNGTRYTLTVTEVTTEAEGRILGAEVGSRVVVHHYRGKVMVVPPGPVFASYVREKLGVGYPDAEVLAELFAHLGGAEYVSMEGE